MYIPQIFANFAISYAANNVPTLRELINRKNGLDDRIEECFEKALKRWSINSGVRGIEKSRMNTHLQDLQKVLEGNEIPESYQELIKYWIEELKTDSVCYDFVIENKIEIQNVKLTHRAVASRVSSARSSRVRDKAHSPSDC